MAFENVFSYKGKKVKLNGAVGAIVSQHSDKLMYEYVQSADIHLRNIAKVWRKWLRYELSKKSVAPKKNNTIWPKNRTGKLRSTIQEPKLITHSYTKPSGGQTTTRMWEFKLEGLFGRRGSKNHKAWGSKFITGINWGGKNHMLNDVGGFLNDQKDKPFGRWQDRAQRVLFLHVKGRLARINSKNMVTQNSMGNMAISRGSLGWK